MIKLVLFDLDGTLVNSLYDLADSCNYALESLGFATHETEKYKYFVGNGMPKLVERILPADKLDNELHKKTLDIFMNRYREHFVDKTCLYEGIAELIESIKAKGIKIGVVSNKAHEMALRVIEKLFPENTFDMIYGKIEGFPTKPDSALTLKVIDEMGVKPCETVFIGDSGMDAQTAVNAGCIGIGVLWGFREKQELIENGADYIAENPTEILKIIEEIK